MSEEQIIGVLKEAEAGAKTKELCRRHGISQATFYNSKAKYAGGQSVPLCMADVARGPGRLTQAMAIDRRLDGIDLCSRSSLWLASGARPPGRVATSARIGVSKERCRLLRFYEAGNPHVSGPAALRK